MCSLTFCGAVSTDDPMHPRRDGAPRRPYAQRTTRIPEALVAVPAAAVAVLAGLVSPAAALKEVTALGPTVGFLAAILLLGHLVDGEGGPGDRLAIGGGAGAHERPPWPLAAAGSHSPHGEFSRLRCRIGRSVTVR